MADVKQMVTGFNHNVKHRGKAYHVQTEDSGVANPQITTHLFVGGNILATKKTSYADIVTAENLAQVVRELMEEQHKEMLRNLVNGVYDDRDQALSSQARAYQPGQLAAGGAARAQQPAASASPAVKPPPPLPRTAAAAPAASAKPAAAPQVVFRPAVTPPPILSRPGAAPAPVPPRAPVASARAAVAPPTPARRAETAAPPGGDLGPDKSLDEVILSYLAEEPARRK